MKTVLILVLVLFIFSCKKNENIHPEQSCAKCEELHSGYKPPDYCGTFAEVDAYIAKLKEDGKTLGQLWHCSKY